VVGKRGGIVNMAYYQYLVFYGDLTCHWDILEEPVVKLSVKFVQDLIYVSGTSIPEGFPKYLIIFLGWIFITIILIFCQAIWFLSNNLTTAQAAIAKVFRNVNFIKHNHG
jgi:hypothetical protein